MEKTSVEETKSESKLQYPSNPFKYKYLIHRSEGKEVHSNDFDESRVEFSQDTFLVQFDPRLFEVPKAVQDLERILHQIEAESWVQ